MALCNKNDTLLICCTILSTVKSDQWELAHEKSSGTVLLWREITSTMRSYFVIDDTRIHIPTKIHRMKKRTKLWDRQFIWTMIVLHEIDQLRIILSFEIVFLRRRWNRRNSTSAKLDFIGSDWEWSDLYQLMVHNSGGASNFFPGELSPPKHTFSTHTRSYFTYF